MRRSSALKLTVVVLSLHFQYLIRFRFLGILKVWNIDRSQNCTADVLQTITIQKQSMDQPVLDCVPIFSNGIFALWCCNAIHLVLGKVLAVLADNLYMLDLSSENGNNDHKPVTGGLGVCEAADSIYLVTNKVLASGKQHNFESQNCELRKIIY
jgi:hypothetical protein